MPSPTADKKTRSTTKPRQMMRGHNMMVLDVALLRDGRRIITCSTDGSLRVWDLESGANIGEPWQDDGDEEDDAGVSTIALSPTSNTVASGSSDGTVRLWDVETGKVIIKLTGHDGIVWSVCWRADGERLVSGGHDGTIRLWDVTVEGGKIVLGPIETGHMHVYAAMYSPNTTKIVTGGRHWQDNAVKIWDAETGDLLSTVEHHYAVRSLAWTSDEKKLISGSNDGSIRIFDTDTWQQIAILQGHEEVVYAISLFQNDRLLASTSYDNTARLWNLDNNLQVGPPLQHEQDVYGAAISADGKLLVTGCRDENAYVWDIRTILKDTGFEELLSIPDSNAVRRPTELENIRRLPRGFLDNARDVVHSSMTRTYPHTSAHPRSHALTSSSGPGARVLGRLLSHFRRSQPDDPMEFEQRQRQSIVSDPNLVL